MSVITLTNHKGQSQTGDPVELEANTLVAHKKRAETCVCESRDRFWFNGRLDENFARVLNLSQSVVI